MSFCYSYIEPLSQEMVINFWVADNKRTRQYPVAQLTLLSRFSIAPSTFIKYYLQIKAHTYHLYLLFSAFFQPFFFSHHHPSWAKMTANSWSPNSEKTPQHPVLKLIAGLSWFPNTFTAHFFRTSTTNDELFIFLFNHSSPHYRKNFCYQLISSTKADINIFPLSPVKF